MHTMRATLRHILSLTILPFSSTLTGSTYMAASGINPQADERDELAHLCDLVDFAIEMKNKLEDINLHSFNTFQLRIGKQITVLPTLLPILQKLASLVKESFLYVHDWRLILVFFILGKLFFS